MDSDKSKKVDQGQIESQPTVKDVASASDEQIEGTLKLEQPEEPSKNGARDSAGEDVAGDQEQDATEDVNMDVDVGSVEKSDVKDADDGEPASASAAEGDQDTAGSSGRPRVTRSRNPDFAAKQKNFMKEYRRSTGGQTATPMEEVDHTPHRSATTEPTADPSLSVHAEDGSAPAAESSADKRSSSTPAAESSADKRSSSTPAAEYSADKRSSSTPAAESSAARRGSQQSDAAESADSDTPAGAALNDNFCWVCHREGKVICCETCPRVFHLKCVQLGSDPPGDWVCVECRRVVQAENVDNLSATMKQLSQEQFVQLLTYAIGRLKGLPGAEPFTSPVDPKKFPHYREVVACPMDLLVMEQNTKNGMYGSTEAFIADCKWIVHNCILFNSNGSKLTTLAKSLLRMCKWEMEEIETCPDCYGNAYATDNWFMEACPNPHLLIWARLKGFPFWPAKAMKSREGNVDCRFFGRHDRAWVPIKECFLYSKEPPCPPKSRSKSLDSCIEELEEHIRNLEKQFGEYVYAKPRTAFDPKKVDQHLKMTIPGYQCTTSTTDQDTSKRKRSNSDIQLEMLEKLRQGKKARKSVSATLQEVRAAEKNNGDPVMPAADEQEDPDDPIEPATEGVPAADQVVEERPHKNARKSLAGTVRNATSVEDTADKKPAVASPKKIDSSIKDKTVTSAKEKADIAKEKPALAVKELGSAMTAGSNKTLKPAVSGGMRMVPISAAQAAGLKQKVVRVAAALAGSGGTAGVRQMVMMSPGARPQAVRTNGLTPRAARPQQRPGTAALLQMARAPLHGNTRLMAPRAAATLPQPASADSQFTIVGPSTLGPLMVVPGSANTAVVSAAAGPRTTSGLITGAAGDAASSDLGPVSAELAKQAKGLTEMMRTGLEKVLNELAMAGSPQATVAGLKLQLERLQWKHQMELAEQKKVADSMLSEVRGSMEMDQKRALQKLGSSFTAERRELERQMELKVAETKKKQWCANCGKEAIFYCCWNTSYCDFPCQEAQWPKHMLTCANQQGQHQQTVDGGGSDSSR